VIRPSGAKNAPVGPAAARPGYTLPPTRPEDRRVEPERIVSELLAVVLICATSVPPSDCSRDNAIDVVTMPAATAYDCMALGQSVVAGGALSSVVGDDAYLTVRCQRRGTAAADVEPSGDGPPSSMPR
jgi:hypothetical protein